MLAGSDTTQRPAIGQPCPLCGRIGPSYITHAEVERRLDAVLAYDFRAGAVSRCRRIVNAVRRWLP